MQRRQRRQIKLACLYKVVRIAQKVEEGSDKRHETQRTDAIKTEPKYRQKPRQGARRERNGAIERYKSRPGQPQKHRTHRNTESQEDRQEEKPADNMTNATYMERDTNRNTDTENTERQKRLRETEKNKSGRCRDGKRRVMYK